MKQALEKVGPSMDNVPKVRVALSTPKKKWKP